MLNEEEIELTSNEPKLDFNKVPNYLDVREAQGSGDVERLAELLRELAKFTKAVEVTVDLGSN